MICADFDWQYCDTMPDLCGTDWDINNGEGCWGEDGPWICPGCGQRVWSSHWPVPASAGSMRPSPCVPVDSAMACREVA